MLCVQRGPAVLHSFDSSSNQSVVATSAFAPALTRCHAIDPEAFGAYPHLLVAGQTEPSLGGAQSTPVSSIEAPVRVHRVLHTCSTNKETRPVMGTGEKERDAT